MTMAKTKNKRPGKPRGMNYADMLARRKAINAVKLDAAALLQTVSQSALTGSSRRISATRTNCRRCARA